MSDNAFGIRYRYIDGSATVEGAEFLKCAESIGGSFLNAVTFGVAGDPWETTGPETYMRAARIYELCKYGESAEAKAVDDANIEDFGAALAAIRVLRENVKKQKSGKLTYIPNIDPLSWEP